MNAFFDSNIVIDMLAGHPLALAEAALHAEVAISRIT
jgi:predicted nucleic acid-binding protein